MSSAEKIGAFLQSRPAGATSVRLTVHEGGSDGESEVISEWSSKQISDAVEESLSSAIALIDADAQQHVDAEGEPCKFHLQWRKGDDKTLRTISIRRDPEKGEVRKLKGVSDGQTIELLLNANAALCKQVLSSVGSIGTAYERALAKQGELLEHALRRERELMASQIGDGQESAEEKAARERRAAIFAQVAGKVPEALDTALAFAQRALLAADAPGDGAGDGEAGGTH